MFSKVILNPCCVVVAVNMGSRVFSSVLSITVSFSDIGIMRGRLPFSGWLMLTVFRAISMSIHLTCTASPMRVAVSFRNWSNGANVLPEAAISWSISVSVGMK